MAAVFPTTALAIPAALVGLTYLNARWRLPVDIPMFRSIIMSQITFNRRVRADRANSFYLIEEHARNEDIKGKTFIVYQGESWTFAQTYDMVLRYAGYLHSQHTIQPGDIVAVDLVNSPQFLFLALALWSLGALPAFVNYNLPSKAFVHCVRVSTARLLIVDPETASGVLTEETRSVLEAPDFRSSSSPLQVVVLTQDLQSSIEGGATYRAPSTARSGLTARSPCVLIFTSGTTGLPKAAIVHWQRISLGAELMSRWLCLRPVSTKNPDRYYTAMPLFHSAAFSMCFHCCLTSACTMILSRRFSASNFWDEVAASDATVIQYVGETLRYLLATPPDPNDRVKHRVRLAVGNGLRPDVWDRFKERFGIEAIAEFYGATESVYASFNFSRNTFSSGAIGQVGILGELQLLSKQSIVEVDWETEAPRRDPRTRFCVKVPRGQPGELLYSVDAKDLSATYQGYHGNKEASDSKILRDVHRRGDAWFRSGDMVRFDKEGRLWFSDRIGDTFRWRSENVSTAEVAQVLGQHPAILESNVYGVQIPNHDGRAGCAAVMLKDVTHPESPVSESVLKSMASHSSQALPKYAVPVFLRVVVMMEVTGTNKHTKHMLRADGVDPSKVGNDRVFYLRPGGQRYEPFGTKQWNELKAGNMKL